MALNIVIVRNRYEGDIRAYFTRAESLTGAQTWLDEKRYNSDALQLVQRAGDEAEMLDGFIRFNEVLGHAVLKIAAAVFKHKQTP